MLLPVVRCESRSSPAMAEQVTAVAYTAGRPEGLGSLQVRDRSVQVEWGACPRLAGPGGSVRGEGYRRHSPYGHQQGEGGTGAHRTQASFNKGISARRTEKERERERGVCENIGEHWITHVCTLFWDQASSQVYGGATAIRRYSAFEKFRLFQDLHILLFQTQMDSTMTKQFFFVSALSLWSTVCRLIRKKIRIESILNWVWNVTKCGKLERVWKLWMYRIYPYQV